MGREMEISPLSLRYMKTVRLFLRSVAAWPSDDVLRNSAPKLSLLQTLLICQATIVVMGQANFIFHNFRILSFFFLGDVYVILFLGFMTLYRCIMPAFKNYGIIIALFLNKFHLIHFRHMGHNFEKIYVLINKLSNYFTFYMMSAMILGVISVTVSPTYNNYKNGVFSNKVAPNYSLQFSVYYKLPGYDQREHFAFTTLLNLWICYGCSVSVCVNDLLLSLVVFQIIGHIKILINNLENFPVPSSYPDTNKALAKGSVIFKPVALFSAEENELVNTKIKECVDHHRLIVSFTREITYFFGPMMALNYLYHLVGCCLLLLEVLSGEPGALLKYGPLTFIIFGQLIQISFTFEVVGSKSEKIIEAVYAVPWESMDVRNQRSVCILLKRVQTPIHVTALGIANVGVTTMLQILKTTISYYGFLRSVDK